MKAGYSKTTITPKVGTAIAGYEKNIISTAIHDDLMLYGLFVDDGVKQALMLSYDLIGLESDTINNIRVACAGTLNLSSTDIIVTCTHTHSGPHTRINPGCPYEEDYLQQLIALSTDTAVKASEKAVDVEIYDYSTLCNENINRRVILPDNSCQYLPLNKHLTPLATGITDPELGVLFLIDSQTKASVATVVNYAAHPLTCQTMGMSSRMISADYPGVLRRIVEDELGGGCIFTSGACGDLHPRGFEEGFKRTEEMGAQMARLIINCFTDAIWNPDKYKLENVAIATKSTFVELPLRPPEKTVEQPAPLKGKDSIKAEVQLLAIGSIAFAGMPGEILVEPALSIKWLSPFRKTYILYNSTAYLSYIPHSNAYYSGGYEAETSFVMPSAALPIIQTTVKALEALSNNEEKKL